MEQATTIGLDIAKHVFQVHGADGAGHVLFRKRITRAKLLSFLAAQARCVVAMEACASAHYWAREIAKLGHHVRLIAPAYVKPFIKRQKNDAADAEAICEAAQRPSMRFVPVKTEEQQANGIVFRARDLLVRQRTQCVNALRGHLMEYGYVFPKGITHVETLVALVEDLPSSLPDSVRVILKLLVDTFTALEAQITALYAEINQRSKSDPTARRAPHSIQHYRLLASAWKHFEGLPRLPRGVLPVADALCRFNPIHGQGMSSAAKQARLLQDVLGRAGGERDPIAALQMGFMAEVASVLETPWTMSTSADLAFPGTRGERPDNFAEAQRFEATLFRAAIADPVVHRAMMEVAQLLRPHQRLREPDIMRRIEAASLTVITQADAA